MSSNTKAKPSAANGRGSARKPVGKAKSPAATGRGGKKATGKLAGANLPTSDQWSRWVQHLAARSKPLELVELVPDARTHPLKWALPDHYDQCPSPRLLKQLCRLHKGRQFASAQTVELLGLWLEQACQRKADSLFGLECLGWAHALPRLAQIIPEPMWRELIEQLEEIIESAGGITLHDDPVPHQLLQGELPWTLSSLFPEIGKYRKLRKPSAAALSLGTVELTDGEGLVNSRHLAFQRQLLACWTRCSLLASAAGNDCFDEDARNQYEWSVRQSLRTSRSDGSLVLASGLSGQWCADLMTTALDQGGDRLDQTIADVMLPGARNKLSLRQARKLPEPSIYSEWSELCVMRSRWSRKSPQFTCAFGDGRLESELWVGGRVLWSGRATPQLHVNGRELSPSDDWTEVCWFTDEDVDYLELEGSFADGWRVQRQILLAREDDFLLIADAVLGEEASDVRYRHPLPLAPDIGYQTEEETWEGYLKNSRPLCTVMPLGLPEWRQAAAPGSLQLEDGTLCLTVQGTSVQRLYAPLFFDLSPRRWVKKRTWRQLTVAEHLEIKRPDVAVAYRVQVGRKQWIVYRSLAPQGNRTFLGQNVSQEFIVARFDLDGRVEELIEIE